MQKIELKHIAPYLVYDLKYVARLDSDILNDTWADESINNTMTFSQALEAKDKRAIELLNSPITIDLHLGYEDADLHLGTGEFSLGYPIDDVFAKEVKPLLRPMSDLFENIVHNGSVFLVAELLLSSAPNKKDLWGINTKQKTITNITRERFYKPVQDSLSLPYWAIEMLFKYHFDVFGLIEKGLAEPIKNK